MQRSQDKAHGSHAPVEAFHGLNYNSTSSFTSTTEFVIYNDKDLEHSLKRFCSMFIGALTLFNFVRTTSAESFCQQEKGGIKGVSVCTFSFSLPLMKQFPEVSEELELAFTIKVGVISKSRRYQQYGLNFASN